MVTCYMVETFAGRDTDAILGHHVYIAFSKLCTFDRSLGPICCFVETPVRSHVGGWNHAYRNIHVLAKPTNGTAQGKRLKKKTAYLTA